MRRIWIDTDLALGAPRGDVDDGFAVAAVAMAAALHPRQVELLGISVVTGNAPAGIAFDCTKRLLAVLGTETTIVPEANAAQALASLPADASVLAIGPPRNLVAAAAYDPDWPARTSVRVVGTVHRPWRHLLLRWYCLNFGRQRADAAHFFRLSFQERRIFPLDVVQPLRFGRKELATIGATGTAGAYLAHHSERWLRQAPLRYRSASFPAWDLVAALDVLGGLPGIRFAANGIVEAFDPIAASQQFFALLSGFETGRPLPSGGES